MLVRDKSSGQVRLVTEKQLFIPGPNESIETLSEIKEGEDHILYRIFSIYIIKYHDIP